MGHAEKVFKAGRPTKRKPNPPPVVVRKETNQEIITKAINRHGRVRLNVYVKMKHPDSDTYLGFKGSGMTVDAPTAELAHEFPKRLKDAIVRLAREMGLNLPDLVIVEREA